MHNAARFGRSQSARNLLDNFQGERKRQWTFPPDFGLERFAFYQLHHIEAFAVLFTVMTDPRDVWMVNVRSGAGFTQKARPYTGSLRDFPINHFQRYFRIQNGIARAIGYCHGTSSELNCKSVG